MVECGGLENRCTARYRGFESLLLCLLTNPVNSDFFKSVYEVVKLIPYGKVTSYGAIAKYLGTTKSARVVGWAMNNSHNDSSIPAHRVVNRNGLLTGKHHFPGENLMEELLINNYPLGNLPVNPETIPLPIKPLDIDTIESKLSKKVNIEKALKDYKKIDFKFEDNGTRITYFD